MTESSIGLARTTRRALAFLGGTPFHPQWFAHRSRREHLGALAEDAGGRVLDVGCAAGDPRAHLAPGSQYIGLDYYATASAWYGTLPEVYGDAARLPFGDATFDAVLLLDVLEHLPDAAGAMQEACRVLRPGGRLVLQVPFLYPLHDAPLDFQRWTVPGLERLVQGAGLSVSRTQALGSSLETAALLANLGASKAVLDWAQRWNPLALLGIALPFFVLFGNVAAWLLSCFLPRDFFMSHAFRMVAEKPA